MKKQKGFTLIELVMVIVILGILAVTAIPQFIDLQDEARQAAVDGVAGALSAGAAINYAARSANSALGDPIATCADVANTLQGGLPTGVSITAPAATTGCAVDHDDDAAITANFEIIIIA